MKNGLAFIFLVLISTYTHAATRYWVGTFSTNWNNTSNWSSLSGGAGGASVPTSADDVIFDGNGLVNCNINTNAICKTLTVQSGYTNTITQLPGFTVTISGASTWAGGTFSGGNSTISNSGTFTLSGTAFTSTSATLTVGNNFSFTSGSFAHNNGTVSFDFTSNFGANSISVSHSSAITFNDVSTVPYYNTLIFNNSPTINGNLTLSGTGTWLHMTIATGQSLTVNGTLYITGSEQVSINTGSINANGDITITNSSVNTGGSGTINITGTSIQTLTGSGTINKGNLPNININKPSGTLSLVGYITCTGPSWTHTVGTIDPGTSTVCFFNTGSPYTISGTHTLNNVVFYGNYSTYTVNNNLTTNDLTFDAAVRCVVTIGSSITVNGTLTYKGTDYVQLNTGTLNVKGDVINNNTNATHGGGTASFVVNGAGNQSITGTSATDQGAYPPFTINKLSGTLAMSGYLTFYNGFTWIAGTVDPGLSTCVFYNVAAISQSISASAAGMSFYNIIFAQPDYLWTSLATDISVLGSLKINASCGVKTNNHNISIGGDFTNLNTTATGASYAFNGGTSTVTFNGTGPQTITMNNPSGSSNKAVFYNLVINNTAAQITNDDITLADVVRVSNTVTFINGRILSTSNNYLYLLNGATANTGTSVSYVNGPMGYDMAFNGSRTLNFPIGDGSNWRYVVLDLTHNAATSYTYTAQITHSSAGALGYTLPATIERVSGARYTTIDRTATGGAASNANLSGNQQITLYYDADDQVSDCTNLTIAKTTGSDSPWVDIGGNATANTTGTITSTSSPTGFTGFSKFSLANRLAGSNPLPVKLTYFNAKLKDKKVDLSWQTASENVSDYFEIDRSNDGNKWERIQTVKAAGNSNEILDYSVEDDSPYLGKSYYRLKQFDLDGQFEIFQVVMVNNQSSHLEIYPNPVVNCLIIDGENLGTKSYRIINQLGTDMTTNTQIVRSDKTRMVVDLSALPPQAYLVRINNSSFRIYKQ